MIQSGAISRFLITKPVQSLNACDTRSWCKGPHRRQIPRHCFALTGERPRLHIFDMNELLSLADIETLARDVLIRAGTSAANAAAVARSIRLAERDALRGAGLAALPDVVEHLRCGRVNGRAVPRLHPTGPTALSVDADGGFACPAFEAGLTQLIPAAHDHGIAILTIRDTYPMTLPAHPAESCAVAGLVGICLATMRVPQPGGSDIATPRQMALAVPNGDAHPTIRQDRAATGTAFATFVQLLAAGLDIPDTDAGGPVFEGPLGGLFQAGHCLLAINPDALGAMSGQTRPDPTAEALQATRDRTDAQGVDVPATLLQQIITA
jgi:LDH2 family malate/lactate/ureidoglycolate dehydrogenase